MGREGAYAWVTQNLCHKRFFSACIQDGSAPIAVGYAWTLKRLGENAIALAPDWGTPGEGTLDEALTFTVRLKAPLFFPRGIRTAGRSLQTLETRRAALAWSGRRASAGTYALTDSQPTHKLS